MFHHIRMYEWLSLVLFLLLTLLFFRVDEQDALLRFDLRFLLFSFSPMLADEP